MSALGDPANPTPRFSKLLLSQCNASQTPSAYPIHNVNGVSSQSSMFNKGTLVEVSSDEDGFQDSWFFATVVEHLSNGNFLIEYKSLRNDDDTDFLREEVDSPHIRPCPPNLEVNDCFRQLEEVDALYNDGWWVGVVSKVLNGQRYVVYFRGSNEESEFKHSDLRPHLEWISGTWVSASQVLNTPVSLDEITENPSPLSLKNPSFLTPHVRTRVTVHGYKVKEQFASLLTSIFSKYGDIAKNSSQKSTESRSSQLEHLCAIYQDLEKKAYSRTSTSEIESMLAEVKDLETVNLEVGWLRERLQDIYEALKTSEEYVAMKGKKEKNTKDFENVQKKICAAEKKRASIVAEGKKIDEALLVTTSKLGAFEGMMKMPMLDGLL